MSKKNGFVMPVVILTVICLVVSVLLAYVNSITAPVIKTAALKAETEARSQVLPLADNFSEVDLNENIPSTVDSIYMADNGEGYVITLTGAGYGGNVTIIVGIGSDGLISGTSVLSQSETAGLGTRITNEDFQSQFLGKDSSLDGVDVISGSTVSSNCFISLINDAFTAVENL